MSRAPIQIPRGDGAVIEDLLPVGFDATGHSVVARITANKFAADSTATVIAGTLTGNATVGFVAKFVIPATQTAEKSERWIRAKTYPPAGADPLTLFSRPLHVVLEEISSTASVTSSSSGGASAALIAHLTNPTGAHAASAVSFVPTGTIASTDVQAAIVEVSAKATAPNAPNVLQFGGVDATVTPTPATSVNVGQLWPMNQSLGPFSCEAWVCIGKTTSEYFFSEGYGGAHAILFGLSPIPQGNVGDGTNATLSFSGGYTAQVGEWVHARLGWDGTFLYVWINGVVVNIQPWAGPRGAQQGVFYVGGSDHSNFFGRIAGVRMYEGWCPKFNMASHEGIWTPPRPMMPSVRVGSSYLAPAQLCMSFVGGTGAAGILPDTGDGYNGQVHHGVAQCSANGAQATVAGKVPGPFWVTDATAPFSMSTEPARTRVAPTPTAAPTGAKIWDSVGRADSIPAFTPTFLAGIPATSPGSTEGGTLGPLVWQLTNSINRWCVFDGTLCPQIENPSGIWVSNNSADMTVSVNRADAQGYDVSPPANVSRTAVQLLFRYLDESNHLRTYIIITNGLKVMRLVQILAGVQTDIAEWPLPNYTWTEQKITAVGSTITAFIDGTQIGQATGVTSLQTQLGVGLWSNGYVAARARNFKVA